MQEHEVPLPFETIPDPAELCKCASRFFYYCCTKNDIAKVGKGQNRTSKIASECSSPARKGCNVWGFFNVENGKGNMTKDMYKIKNDVQKASRFSPFHLLHLHSPGIT